MRVGPPSSPAVLASSQGREDVDVLSKVPTRIRTIWASSDNAGIVSRMRDAPLGRLYRERLKQYAIVRSIARWIWWNIFPLYVRMSVWTKKRYPLVALSNYARTHEVAPIRLAEAESIETTQPRIYPICEQSRLPSLIDRYQFPEIFVAATKNGTVMGGTNLVLVDGTIVCHDLYDFRYDWTAEEMHGRALISPGSKHVRLVFRDKNPETVPAAATFVDACAPNYAHWMTEVLPRLALFCTEERFKGVPVIVNDGLHPNIMESLFLIAGANREVIKLPIGKALVVENLYLTSVAGYVPFERRGNFGSGHSHGKFSGQALKHLRRCVEGAIGHETKETEWPKKLYLRRNSGVRKIANAVEIETLMSEYGFFIIDPEQLTFRQQVEYFSRAHVIVGPTGAGFANTVFCQPGTHGAVLISKHKDLSYKYWVNMLNPLGINFSYVLGDISDNHEYGVHSDFVVDTSYLMEFLADLEQNLQV